MRPLFMLQTPDGTLMDGAWEEFRPGLQISTLGAVYGGAGALLGLALARFVIGALRSAGRAASGAARMFREHRTVGGVRVDPGDRPPRR
jgi:hypothetical protein